MSSPSQKHGSCGHIMASFDSHSFCARCREKGKGSDPCISHNDCTACNSLTEDQRIQLSTPSYRLKKEKRDLKKSSDTPAKDSSSSSLIDPSSVMVVGAVDAQGVIQSPGSSSDKKKKKPNPPEKKSSNQNPKSGKEKPSKSPTPQSHRSSSDTRIDELDLKWSERFNRLEALLLAKSLDKPEPTFASVKVTPTHSPPVGVVKSSEPSFDLLTGLNLQICQVPTTLHRDSLLTSRLLSHLRNRLQICLVLHRLPVRANRPANCQRISLSPANQQTCLVPAHLLISRSPASRPQHRPADRAQLP